MTVRLSLLLILGAFANFSLAIILNKLNLASFAELATKLGAMILLCAFLLLVLPILVMILQAMATSALDYFSTRQRLERRLLFYVGKLNQLDRHFHLKKTRLLYFNQQQRKRLLNKANRNSAS